MEVLKQLFNDIEIKSIIDANPYIKYREDRLLADTIKAISNTNCTNKALRSIILDNPFILLREAEDINELIDKMREYNIKKITKIIEEYPYILLKNAYEIDGYYIKSRANGINIEDATTKLEEYPYIIDKE